MDSFASENVDVEKMVAKKNFERRTTFWKLLPVIEVCFVVLLLLSWLTPFLSTGEYLLRLIFSGMTGGIFIFGVMNVLIALIFSLSNRNKLTEPDLYFQYVSSSPTTPIEVFSSSASSTVALKSIVSEKEEKKLEEKPLATTLENKDTARLVGEDGPTKREMVRAVSDIGETDGVIRRKQEMTFLRSAKTESSVGDHVYRRSRSERLDWRGGSRRGMRGLGEIDDLSSDEFRSTVEMFIAGKKKMLLKEWMKP